ncbi:pentapeptide repeat-containing protein [Campylobacter coli]|uniref:pentapeptide repeat-containing protein n=1 Tax=Campylobacter coli TaxID=195 RepID=UPI002FF221C3
MDSEILTLSQDEIENIKKELCRILGYRCKDKIEVINEVNINNFGFAHDKKKHKNLFIISNKEKNLLDLEIDLKKMSSLADMDYQIKFEGYTIKFTDSFSKEKIKIGQNLYFNNCDFKVIELKNICFKNFEIDGCRYESEQKKPIVFRACEFKELSLNNSIFSESIKFEEETKIKYLDINLSEFKKYFFMQNCIIENISLWKNKFKDRCYFVDSKFGYKDKVNKAELNFSNAHFENNAYFNNSEFYNYADFHECEFEKIACFYGVKFDKTPNFSQAIFKGNLNVVNTNLNFTFDNLEEKIKQEYGSYKSQRIAKEVGVIPNLYQEKSLDKFANDFRDSFRNFKSTLIKDNNLLDASNFHKYELYCKELELKNKKDKTLKDRIDKWQLSFYRKLCDHHTDILQSLNSLILVIGIFVISSVVMVASFNYRLGYKPILEHWYFSLDFYNHHINSIIQDNYLFVVKVNFAMLFGYLGLVGFALCLKYIREFFIIISYGVTLSVLAVSPKILIPAMGIFTDKRSMLDPLSTIGGIYTIVFGFVVFSFIKTIRKNSIVPS